MIKVGIKLFKKNKYVKLSIQNSKEIEVIDNKVLDKELNRCVDCNQVLTNQMLNCSNQTCPHCGKHFRISARARIELLADKEGFIELYNNIYSQNPLSYPEYSKKLEKEQNKTSETEAVVCGKISINQNPAIIAVMNSEFMMGSMGSVVGEKITLAIEEATKECLPMIIVTASGGARMQEGIYSLMQMAKCSGALKYHHEKGLLSIILLTDPTTGGVTASFAMLGDIILSEPKTLIGFAGPRVIEQTIRQSLPEGFQRAEFLLEHGFIDKIVHRNQLKETIGQILLLHREVENELI